MIWFGTQPGAASAVPASPKETIAGTANAPIAARFRNSRRGRPSASRRSSLISLQSGRLARVASQLASHIVDVDEEVVGGLELDLLVFLGVERARQALQPAAGSLDVLVE